MKILWNLLAVIAVVALIGAMAGLGSDTSRWDCPGEPTPCEVSK